MRLALASLKGSPGVSVTAYALARILAAEGRDTVLVEADPSGGDLASRMDLPLGDGLLSLAAEARRGASAEMVGSHLVPFAEHLAVLPSPTSGPQAAAAIEVLAPPLATALEATGTEVVIDLGRLAGTGSPTALLRAAEVVALVVQPSLTHAAYLTAASAWLGELDRPTVLVVVDAPSILARQPRGEEMAALGSPWAEAVATVAWDPRAVRALHQPGGTARLSRRPLWRSVSRVLETLGAICGPTSGPLEPPAEPAVTEAAR